MRSHRLENFSFKHVQFIKDNWTVMSDKQIAAEIGRSVVSIQGKRFRLGLIKTRPKNIGIARSKIAAILELFANGNTVISIARVMNKDYRKVNSIIDQHYMRKQRSYDTVTLVLESKINYD